MSTTRKGTGTHAGAGSGATSGGGGGPTTTKPETQRTNFPCHVVHVTWDLGEAEAERLLAITDTACSRSVAGSGWVDGYIEEAKRRGCEPQFLSCKEAFRFGASKVFVAGYAIVVCFRIGKFKVALKVAVVNGEVPLLVSRPALGQLGMVMDVALNTATFKKLEVHDMELRITETGHPALPIEPASLPKSYQGLSSADGPELQIFSVADQYMEGDAFAPSGLWDSTSTSDFWKGYQDSSCAINWMTTSTSVPSASFSSDDVVGFDSSREDITPTSTEYSPENQHDPLSTTTPKSVVNVFYPKKIAVATKNLLLDENFNAESFMNWWKGTNISNDFWVENDSVLIRIHVVPRRTFFDPSNWNTQNLEQKALGQCKLCHARRTDPFQKYMAHGATNVISHPFRCSGLEEQCFVGDDSCLISSLLLQFAIMSSGSALLTAPMITRPKTLWELTKAELVHEAQARNLWFHDSWTTTELRSLIQEDRRNVSQQQLPVAGLSKMNIEDLKAKATELGYKLPPAATRGTILRIVRDQNGMGPESLMTFGRFSGKKFIETPVSYREWAVREGELFKMEKEHESKPTSSTARPSNYMDPETHASIPYTDEAGSLNSWSEVTVRSSPPREGYGARPKAKSTTAPRTPPTRRTAMGLSGPLQGHCEQDAEEIFYECEDVGGGGERNEEDQCGSRPQTYEPDEIDDYLVETYVLDEGGSGKEQPSMNPGGSGDVIQREPSGVKSVYAAPEALAECERMARQKLSLKKFSYGDLLEIAQMLPLKCVNGKRGSRRGGGDPYRYFLGGMYTYGKFFGIAKGTRNLPWTTRYINVFAREKFSGPWTSFVLFRDTATQVHADVHNLPGTSVTTVSFGNFSGGELWIEAADDSEGISRKAPDGALLTGKLQCTKEKPFCFDGKTRHATQPWEGERWALSCFTTRGYAGASTRLKDELRELRFPLRGLPLCVRDGDLQPPDPHRVPRPKKSIRKGLWKATNRLAMLTTWCTAAASCYVADNFPLSRGPDAATLLEIGGYTKTMEVTEMNYVAIEPYEYDPEITLGENTTKVEEIFENFSPPTLWVHGEQPLEFLYGLLPVFHKQINLGPLCELGVLRFNDPSDEGSGEGEQDVLDKFVNYVSHPDPRRDDIGSNECDYLDELHGKNESSPAERQGHPSPEEPHGAEITADEGDRGFHREETYVVDQQRARSSGDPSPEEPRGAEAISFEKGKALSPEVRSSLKRLHQNMGHPSNLDLARHLRLAGADATVVEACKRLRCQVCHRNQRGASAKPATLPNLLDFNQLVAVDAFYVYDCDGEKVELMMIVDVGTGFISAGVLQGHSASTMESSFCTIWSNTFGAPGTMIVDLESGLQSGLGRFSEWHGTKIRPVAGQAHWQNGTVERAIRTWKEIWGRLVDEWSASSEEAGMIITATNTAMNTLRRETGFSPAQAVWGRDPQLPEELKGTPQDEHVEHIISHDRQRAREHSLRISAKEAYFKVQNDSRLRRSLLQRSRVAGPEVQQGAHVFFYRKPKNNKNWEWHGPGVVIGREGPNAWVSFSGRCHLVAPEHLRSASAEELGAAFAMRSTQQDLQKLLEQDFADEEMYEGEDMELDDDLGLAPEGTHQQEGQKRGEGVRRARDQLSAPLVAKRHRTKVHLYHEAYMLKLPKTPRGREKALEKELPWSLIPPEQHQGFKDAELKQWNEHVEHEALEPLSVEESREVLRTKAGRVLNSRFAYRDKLWSRRRQDPTVGWKHKARLVIAGHRDPDLLKGLPTHAPTISRQGILLLLQILSSNLENDWNGYAGDVTAAFLCGEELQRELYLRQPRSGLGNLHPEQLLRIRKPIFGLVDSPSAWWQKFRSTMRSLVVHHDGKRWMVVQSTLDHCIFMVQEVLSEKEGGGYELGPPQAYLGVHVDDVLLVGKRALCEVLKAEISKKFPIRDWETEKFEYVRDLRGQGEDQPGELRGHPAESPDHAEASETQKHDNMSLIGALSWMASQTRPDLQVGVSMSQQRQKDPLIGDVRFTNQLARRAMEHRENGLELYPIDLQDAVLLCYHDAGWANVPQDQEDPYYALTKEEDAAGLITDGPFARKNAKAKKANSSITSQLGGIYMLANREVLHGTPSKGSILDWRSGACDRVCRSTFAAETMACCTATETGDYIARFLETLLTGKLERKRSRFTIRFLTDCRSLYDHLTRDGIPRVPSCKRLAIDLAGIREDIANYGRIVWVPTWAQLADVLTKPLKADQWWGTVHNELKLTFLEKGECIEGEILHNQCKA
ncbi:RE1 [Symbiodinium sp. CCMP2592]|nr:RE1 [Symbiodinium sp. CCMP2592]